MALITAKATGNWSAGSTWDSDPALPQAGDTVECSTYVVTIDQDVTVVQIQSSSSGNYNVSAARTITANILSAAGASANVLAISNTTGTVTINGTVTAGPTHAVHKTGAGTLTINGVCTGSATAAKYAYNGTGSSGSLNITGNLVGGAGTNSTAVAFNTNSPGVCTIEGDVTANAGLGLNNGGTGTVNITGNVTGGGTANIYGLNNGSTGTVNITGNATGGTASIGVYNTGAGTVIISGNATANSAAINLFGAYNASTGTLRVGNAVAATGGDRRAGLAGSNPGGTTTFKIATYASDGSAPTASYCKMEFDQDVNYIRVIRSDTGDPVDLSNDYPAITDVKKDVVYKLTTLTGTYDQAASAVYPLAADVLDTDVAYGPNGNDYAGTYHAPDTGEVIDTAVYGPASATAGTYHTPDPAEVIDTAAYGDGSIIAGTYHEAEAGEVQLGVNFGPLGAYVGTLAAGGAADWTAGEKEQIRQALGITGDVAATTGTGTLEAAFAALATDADIAAAILVTPANKLETDASGHVSISGTKTTLDALNDAAAAPSAASVADAVWNETLGDHAVAGSTGAALSAAGSAGDPWLTDLPGAYADGTAGDIIGNLIDDIGAITPAVAISATQAASVSTGALAIRTHHTLSQAITSTTTSDLSAATKLWLTVKSRRTDTDAQSVVFIEETAGLTVLAGAAYTTVAHGTLVVGGLAGAWTVTVGLDEVATSLLTDYAESMLWAECKALVGGSTVAVWDGVCDVSHGLVVAVA